MAALTLFPSLVLCWVCSYMCVSGWIHAHIVAQWGTSLCLCTCWPTFVLCQLAPWPWGQNKLSVRVTMLIVLIACMRAFCSLAFSEARLLAILNVSVIIFRVNSNVWKHYTHCGLRCSLFTAVKFSFLAHCLQLAPLQNWFFASMWKKWVNSLSNKYTSPTDTHLHTNRIALHSKPSLSTGFHSVGHDILPFMFHSSCVSQHQCLVITLTQSPKWDFQWDGGFILRTRYKYEKGCIDAICSSSALSCL